MDLYVYILYKGILKPRNNCMSHKVVADEWYDPAAQKFDFSGLISKIRDALDKIYDRYGITGLEPGKGLGT